MSLGGVHIASKVQKRSGENKTENTFETMLDGVKNFENRDRGDDQQRFDQLRRDACLLALLGGFIAWRVANSP
jgi:hypothetical protein